tara:strand:- start:53 stop:340 length:288 start_codon:yes stop_codon:yes gene_type:complete
MSYIFKSPEEAQKVLTGLGLNSETPGRGNSYNILTNSKNGLPEGTQVGILLQRPILRKNDPKSIIWIKDSKNLEVRTYQEGLRKKLDKINGRTSA